MTNNTHYLFVLFKVIQLVGEQFTCLVPIKLQNPNCVFFFLESNPNCVLALLTLHLQNRSAPKPLMVSLYNVPINQRLHENGPPPVNRNIGEGDNDGTPIKLSASSQPRTVNQHTQRPNNVAPKIN